MRPTRAAWLRRVRARHSDDGCLGRAEVSQGGISRRIVTSTLGFRIVIPRLALIDERVLRQPVQLPVAKSDQLERSQRQEPQLPDAEPFQFDSLQLQFAELEGAQRKPAELQRAPVERAHEEHAELPVV